MLTAARKKSALFFLLFLCTWAKVFSQPPPGINFQALARDPQGNPAKNRTVYIKDALIQGTATGTLVYEETFQLQTDENGIFNIIIGQGTQTAASTVTSISQVNWPNGPFFYNIKVAVAPTISAPWWNAASNYQDYGTTQLWSQPYALYAGNASVTNVNTSIQPGPANTFLVTDSSGRVAWKTPQAAQVNVTQVSNVTLALSSLSAAGTNVTLAPNTTTLVTLTVPGAKVGDPVIVAALGDNKDFTIYSSWVSNADEVSVRFANFQNLAVSVSGNQYKIVIIK